MKNLMIIAFTLTYITSGILMFVFWLTAMFSWLGMLGIFLAIILSPGAIVFPLVYWFVEGIFPFFYFILWAMAILSFGAVTALNQD